LCYVSDVQCSNNSLTACFREIAAHPIRRSLARGKSGFDLLPTDLIGKDDELEAFRYAYRYGFITVFYGEKVAKTLLQKDTKDFDTKTLDSITSMSMKLWNAKVGINAGSLIDKAIKGHDYDMDTIKNALSNQIVDEMKKGNMKTTPSDFRNYDDFDLETGVGVSNRVKDDSKNKKDNKSDNDNSALKIEIEKDELMPSTSAPVGYHYEQTPCVGSYEVEGYTRDDGLI